MSNWQRKRSFTLVELLVVIAIISILAALLLPALNNTRNKTKQIACLNNLKQMGTALALYSNDYGGALPPHRNGAAEEFWPHYLNPYLGKGAGFGTTYIGGSFLKCPSNTSDLNLEWYQNAYGCSTGRFWYYEQVNSDKLERVPANAFLVMDSLNVNTIWNPGIYGYNPATDNNAFFWHSNGANILYGDIHVGWLKKTDWIANKDNIWGN